jgi:hypothetical protein
MVLGLFASFSPQPASAASNEDLLATYLQTLYKGVSQSEMGTLQAIYNNAVSLQVYDASNPRSPWTLVYGSGNLDVSTLAITGYNGDAAAAATNVSYLLKDFAELIYYGGQGSYSDSVLDGFWNQEHSPYSSETNAQTVSKIAGSTVSEDAFCGYMYSSLLDIPKTVTQLLTTESYGSGVLADPTTNLFVQNCLASALNDVATTGGYSQFSANPAGANWNFGRNLIDEGYRYVDGEIDVINGVPSLGEIYLVKNMPWPTSSGGGGGNNNTPTTYPAVPPPAPPTEGIPESVFIARWPGHVALEAQAIWIPSPASGSPPASFVALAPDPSALAAAKAQGLEQRVYYFNEKVQKWIALASYPQADGSVEVKNDGAYSNCWTAMFGVLEPHFTDIAGNWSEDVVNRMNGLALFEGYPIPGDPNALDRLAGVDRNVTRAEFATILARALGCLPPAEQKLYGVLLPEGQSPDQVLAGWQGVPDWSRDFVAGMVYSGLAKGEGSDDFAGNDPITRAEAATMIGNVMQKMNIYTPASLTQFSDAADVPDWARLAAGVLTGYPNGTLLPNTPITRAESLVTVLKLLRAFGW